MKHCETCVTTDRYKIKYSAGLKRVVQNVWEMSMKDIIDMSRQRGYFVDQSQSLNLFMQNANYSKLTSMHFYAWMNECIT
jgi:ribonucleoside-diphosphate reductase alpha chain